MTELQDHEVLDRATCLALLGQSSLGRLAMSSAALPHVEPVQFRLVGDEVLARVSRRTRLDIAATDNVVAFEVDAFDPVGGSGWSVVVTGVARRIDNPQSVAALGALEVPPWSRAEDEGAIAISTDVMSGRRIGMPGRGSERRLDRLETAEVLGLDECWRLLRAERVGRLAVIRGHVPLVLPINYVVDGASIIFRTDPGTKFHQGPRSKVCFEIDGLDRAARAGWSVVVTGYLEEITARSSFDYERVRELPLQPWAGGAKRHLMRLVPAIVTGRRVGSWDDDAARERGRQGPGLLSSLR